MLKDLPDQKLYKGYFCVITMIVGYKMDCENNPIFFYDVEFNSHLKKNDPSRQSLKRYPDFDFPTETVPGTVSDEDIIRVEFQDLEYRTYFSL